MAAPVKINSIDLGSLSGGANADAPAKVSAKAASAKAVSPVEVLQPVKRCCKHVKKDPTVIEGLSCEEIDKYRELFDKYDSEKNGAIDPEELN